MPLPSVHQAWAHGVCSQEQLRAAIEDAKITAVETDVVFDPQSSTAFCAHPPAVRSDLPLRSLLEEIVQTNERGRRVHLKIDFKTREAVAAAAPEIDAVLLPFLRRYRDVTHVWLNADVTEGPGRRRHAGHSCPIDADEMFAKLASVAPYCTWSLGWTVHPDLGHSYMVQDIDNISAVLHKHKVEAVVFAVNARMAARDLRSFDALMHRFPKSQLLFWVGTGEPNISSGIKATLDDWIKERKYDAGFDVRICSTWLAGVCVDAALNLYRWLHMAKKCYMDSPDAPTHVEFPQ